MQRRYLHAIASEVAVNYKWHLPYTHLYILTVILKTNCPPPAIVVRKGLGPLVG